MFNLLLIGWFADCLDGSSAIFRASANVNFQTANFFRSFSNFEVSVNLWASNLLGQDCSKKRRFSGLNAKFGHATLDAGESALMPAKNLRSNVNVCCHRRGYLPAHAL